MPKLVDHEQRRRLLADALWRIAERDGIDAATVRRVAAEAGVSVGAVQYYFTTKDEMLQFALQRVGEDLQARLVDRVSALSEPRDPREIVAIVMRERLPLTAARRVHAQVLVAWLGRAAIRPELTSYVIEGTRQMRAYLAGQLRLAQQAGHVDTAVDAEMAADGLLALNEGLAAQLLQGVHTPASVDNVLADHLARIFDGSLVVRLDSPSTPTGS